MGLTHPEEKKRRISTDTEPEDEAGEKLLKSDDMDLLISENGDLTLMHATQLSVLPVRSLLVEADRLQRMLIRYRHDSVFTVQGLARALDTAFARENEQFYRVWAGLAERWGSSYFSEAHLCRQLFNLDNIYHLYVFLANNFNPAMLSICLEILHRALLEVVVDKSNILQLYVNTFALVGPTTSGDLTYWMQRLVGNGRRRNFKETFCRFISSRKLSLHSI